MKLESFESTLREVQFKDDQSGSFHQDLLSAVILCYEPIFDRHITSDLMIVSEEDGVESTGDQRQPFVVRSSKNVTFGMIFSYLLAILLHHLTLIHIDSRFIEMYDEIVTVMKEIERLNQRNLHAVTS